MDHLLSALRAVAEPTRLRLLALAARGEFCVMEFTEILGQSQPRLSRHLKLLCDAGLLDRVPEGANVWFALPTGDQGALPRELVARLPPDDPILVADRRWNLLLLNGIGIRLPETDVTAALDHLVALDRDKKLLSRDITVVDLRLPDRVTVRQSDAAAQARDEVLQANKKKKKGGDA